LLLLLRPGKASVIYFLDCPGPPPGLSNFLLLRGKVKYSLTLIPRMRSGVWPVVSFALIVVVVSFALAPELVVVSPSFLSDSCVFVPSFASSFTFALAPKALRYIF